MEQPVGTGKNVGSDCALKICNRQLVTDHFLIPVGNEESLLLD